MQTIWIREMLHPWLPGIATIGGMKAQAIGADRPTCVIILKMNVKKRPMSSTPKTAAHRLKSKYDKGLGGCANSSANPALGG